MYTMQARFDDMVTQIEWIGPFASPRDFVGTFGSMTLVKSSIDFSRLIVALLVVNFLPAVCLIGLWLRHRRL